MRARDQGQVALICTHVRSLVAKAAMNDDKPLDGHAQYSRNGYHGNDKERPLNACKLHTAADLMKKKGQSTNKLMTMRVDNAHIEYNSNHNARCTLSR